MMKDEWSSYGRTFMTTKAEVMCVRTWWIKAKLMPKCLLFSICRIQEAIKLEFWNEYLLTYLTEINGGAMGT